MLQLKCSWSCSCGCSCSSCSWSGVEVKLKRSRSCSCSGSVVEVVAVVWRSAVAAVYLSVYVYIYIYLFIYLSFCLSIYPSIHLSLYLQAWKRSNSARLPQLLNLTTLKTKLFCENSSILEVDNIKNEAILRDFLQKLEVQCRADGLVPMHFAIFPLHLSKVLRLPRKIIEKLMPGFTKYCACHLPRLPWFLEMLQNLHVLLTFDKVRNPLRLPHKTTSERPKVLPTRQFFTLLTSKCALRHNGAHFFDISTSKSVPSMLCFVHFDLEMCFAPQRRALFQHLNFQKWSDVGVFCTFWLANVLRPTTACNFSSLIWPHGSAPAALASLLFDPPEPQIIGKTVFRDFPTFSRTCIFFLLTLSLLWSSLFCSFLLFSSLTLPTSAVPSVRIVGSLTSKLPLTIIYTCIFMVQKPSWNVMKPAIDLSRSGNRYPPFPPATGWSEMPHLPAAIATGKSSALRPISLHWKLHLGAEQPHWSEPTAGVVAINGNHVTRPTKRFAKCCATIEVMEGVQNETDFFAACPQRRPKQFTDACVLRRIHLIGKWQCYVTLPQQTQSGGPFPEPRILHDEPGSCEVL